MRLVLPWLGALLTLLPAALASALDPRLDVGGFREEDRAVAEELAGYDAEERHAALVAAGEPETLLEISEIQNDSADGFAKLVDGLPRAEQEQVWDLVRYPGLVADLARGGEKSDAELEKIAQRYPEEIRAAIRSEGRTRYATWVEVYALDLEAERAFAGVTAGHPAEVRAAFQRLRARPDLMTLLVDNVGVATRIGAAYREDPTRVEARFDGLHQEVVAARDEQEENWTREMQDPQKREALQSAAREFADEHGYALEDPSNATTTRTRVVHVDHYVNTNPYPYWFGYPSWYAYPYWYPASVWTHVGFSFGGGNGYVGIGLPSPYFLGWYGNYYGGGFGVGYPYGYGGYSYGGFNSWAYPGRYYWGGGYPTYRHHHRGSHYSQHRPRTFHGHRPHHRYDDGSGASRRDRQHAVQERLMKRPHHRFDSRPEGDGRRPHDRNRGEGSTGLDGGRPRSHPDGAGAPDPGLTPGRDRQRLERGHRSFDTRRDDGVPRLRDTAPRGSDERGSRERGLGGRGPGGRGLDRREGRDLPDVSSGPSGQFARRDGGGRDGLSRQGGRHGFQAGAPSGPIGFDRGLARTRLERGHGTGLRPSSAPAPAGLRGGHGQGGRRGSVALGGPAVHRSSSHGGGGQAGGRGASMGSFRNDGGGRHGGGSAIRSGNPGGGGGHRGGGGGFSGGGGRQGGGHGGGHGGGRGGGHR